MRLLTVDPAAGEEQQRCLLRPDYPRQRDAQAEARMEAQPVEIGREARFWRGDAKIRHQRQAEAAADSRPLDGGHDRLGAAEQPHRLLIERAALTIADRLACRRAEI